MGLAYIVVTSVDRDDLPNGGAEQFADVVKETRLRLPDTSVELLIPDFKGNEAALKIVVEAKPDITMPELAADLEAARGVKADPSSLSRVLCQAGFTYKKSSDGLGARTR